MQSAQLSSDLADTQPLRNPSLGGRVGVVIVTWNIGKQVLNSLKRVQEIADFCVIVDNHSSDNTADAIENYITDKKDFFTLVRHPVNNLAKAQNIGISHLRAASCDWAMMLDHDSLPDTKMLDAMGDAFEGYQNKDSLGMIVPNIADKFSCRKARYVRHIKKLFFFRSSFGKHAILDDVMAAISSGSLIPMHVIDRLGGMNEDYCIDNVDYDFSLRIIRSNLKIMAVRDATLYHQLGKCRDHKVMGLCVTTTNHNPGRRYYIYRNRLKSWREHGLAVPAYVLFDGAAIAYDLVKIGLFEANKKAKFQAIWQGIKDAFHNGNKKAKAPHIHDITNPTPVSAP